MEGTFEGRTHPVFLRDGQKWALAHKMPVLAHELHTFAQRRWNLVHTHPKVAHNGLLSIK